MVLMLSPEDLSSKDVEEEEEEDGDYNGACLKQRQYCFSLMDVSISEMMPRISSAYTANLLSRFCCFTSFAFILIISINLRNTSR